MELQFHKSTVCTLAAAVHQVRNVELTQEIKLSDGMPDIGRVLSSWGQILLRSKEWNREEITITGGLTVWSLYVPEDGTEPRSVESWIPFQMKWDVDPNFREGAIRVFPVLRFADSRGVSARRIMVRAGVAALAQALSPQETEVYAPGQLPEDVQLYRRSYPVRSPKEAGERTFLVDEEIGIPQGNPEIEKILSAALLPQILDKKVIGSRLAFKGNANLHLVYRCPEGKIHSLDAELPFSQFAELDSEFGPDAGADIQMAVTSLETDMMEPGKLRLKAGLVGQYLIDEIQLLEVTEDAYSPFREVEAEHRELELPSVLEDRQENVIAEQSLPGQTGQVADVNFLPDFPRIRRNENSAELELPALFQLLYYGDDGSLQTANLRWEGSMSIPVDEDAALELTVQPGSRGAAMARMDAIGVTGQLWLGLRSTAETEIPMVTALELGELRDPDPDRPAVILCRPGEENLWSVAKRCGSTVETIMAVNGLEGEPAPDRMLLIPVS